MLRTPRLVRSALLASVVGLSYCGNVMAQENTEPIATAEPTATATAVEVKEEPAKKLRPLTVSVTLQRDIVLTGVLTDSTMLALKTAFGEASIPLTEVAGVRFPTGQDTSTTVVMLNGDSITGASDVKSITIETEWGSAKVNGQNILALQFVPGLEWQNVNGLNGQRWTLVEPKTRAPLPLASPNGQVPMNTLPNGNLPSPSFNGQPIGGVQPAGANVRPPATLGR